MSWPKDIFRSVLRLGTGEAIARLASFVLVAYISRRYGLELLGAFALAQTAATYVTQGTDQGFRYIGARIVARDASRAPSIVRLITKRKCILGTLCVAAGISYALCGPVPEYARLFLAGFVLGMLPYAFSLDWLAWGLSHFGWLGSWRAGVSLVLAAGSLIGFQVVRDPRVAIVCANFASYASGTAVLWVVWRVSWRCRLQTPAATEQDDAYELRWRAAFSLGLAMTLTQMFVNLDTVLLGAMAPLAEVGRYNAAYRILTLICSVFYLVTQSIYPRLSASTAGADLRKLVLLALAMAVAAGSLIAAVLWWIATPILAIIYGSEFGAAHLLRILVFAVPMDFAAALLGVSFASRGFERYLLYSSGIAALSNLGINLVLIPRMGAEGAAIATILSYVVLLVVLFVGFAIKPIFTEGLAVAQVQAGQD
jgi:O-antigen/teichoic acid export membrane protein